MGNRLIAFVVVFVVAAGARQAFTPSLNDQIAKECKSENATCPKMVDEITRLDNVVAGDKHITYNYTFPTYAKLNAEQKKLISANLEQAVAAANRANPDVKKALDVGVVFTHIYHDDKGAVVVQFNVSGG